MKKYLFILFSIFLVGCVQNNNVETKDDNNIIDLNESNLETETSIKKYYHNSEIKSEVYKEYFYDFNLLKSNMMETDVKDGLYSLLGTDIPLADDYFSNTPFVNYKYDKNNDLLNVGMILYEGVGINNSIIPEDIFVKWIYNLNKNTLEILIEENKLGEDTNYINFNDEEWEIIAEKYRSFIINVAE